jgi:rubrerythrin
VQGRAGAIDIAASGCRWPSALGAAPDAPNPDEIARASPYACLADAVRNEQRAFSFFSYMAAEAEDPQIAAIAEDLARQELQHAAMLRQARRRAWRRERRVTGPWPKPAEITGLEHLLRAAADGEADLGPYLMAAGARDAALKALQSETNARLRVLGVAVEQAEPAEFFGTDREVIDATLRRAEAAFDFYDAVASTASDESVMLRAQDLTTLALDRLKKLRQLM